MSKPIENRIGVEWCLTSGERFKANAGNFTYSEVPIEQGGPYKLTLLRGANRSDPDNEPFIMLSGVSQIKIGEPLPDSPEASRPDFIAASHKSTGDGYVLDIDGQFSDHITAPPPTLRDAG